MRCGLWHMWSDGVSLSLYNMFTEYVIMNACKHFMYFTVGKYALLTLINNVFIRLIAYIN